MLGEAGDVIRARLRRQKSLKLAARQQVGKAYPFATGRNAWRETEQKHFRLCMI
jgi:hypothetical protein